MRSTSLPAVVAAALIGLVACSGPPSSETSSPVVTSVEPVAGYPSAPVELVIHGDNFRAKATQPSGGGSPVLQVPRVFLDAIELTPVKWIDSKTLEVTVPQGFPARTYSVTVVDSYGAGSAPLAAGFTILSEAQFSATLAVNHATVNVGQSFTVTATLTNHGGTEINGITAIDPTVTGTSGGAAILTGPAQLPPSTLAAGAQGTASWTFNTTSAGRVVVNVTIAGTASGTTLTATPPSPVTVAILTPASLSAAWSTSQSTLTTGQAVTVTLVLTNAAGAATANVTGVTPTVTPAASCGAAAPTASAAAPVLIAGGAFTSYSWTCTATVAGSYTFNANVSAVDANSGATVNPTLVGTQVTFSPLPTLGLTVSGNSLGTVTSTPAGISACSSSGGPSCSSSFPVAAVVTLTAAAQAGSSVSWTGCDTNPSAITCSVTVNVPRIVTATFTPAQINLVLAPSGINGGTGSVTSNAPSGSTVPPINACAVAGTGGCTGTFSFGTDVVLTATPGNAGTSVSWTGCDSAAGGVASGNTCTFSNIQAAKNVTVTFALSTPQLRVTASGTGSGAVTSTPMGITQCSATGGTCQAPFNFGTAVTLTASRTPGSSVVWSGCDAPNTGGTADSCVVTNNQVTGKTITATFMLTMPSVTVAVSGNGSGTVSSSPAGISNCSAASGGICSIQVTYGTQVTLTASTGAGSSVTWTGCDSNPAPDSCRINSVTQGTPITATFTLQTFTLTTATTGGGSGTLTCRAGATIAPCAGPHNYGTVVTVNQAATAGSAFTGWSGDCAGAGACSVTMTGNRSVTATFTPQTPTLTVIVKFSGDASGTVSGTPAGISGCGGSGGTCSASYPYGTQVTLTGTPGSGFRVSWSGCDTNPTSTSCGITSLTATRTVTATFRK